MKLSIDLLRDQPGTKSGLHRIEAVKRIEQKYEWITLLPETFPRRLDVRRDPWAVSGRPRVRDTTPMDEIRGRCGATYAFTRSTRTPTGPCAGDEAIARAVVEVFKGCISDVLVYKESNRRKGIGSAHYKYAGSANPPAGLAGPRCGQALYGVGAEGLLHRCRRASAAGSLARAHRILSALPGAVDNQRHLAKAVASFWPLAEWERGCPCAAKAHFP
jgi:hypothetical protein